MSKRTRKVEERETLAAVEKLDVSKAEAPVGQDARARGVDPAVFGLTLADDRHPGRKVTVERMTRGGKFDVRVGDPTGENTLYVWGAESVRRLLARTDCIARGTPKGYTAPPAMAAEAQAVVGWYAGCGAVYGADTVKGAPKK